MSMMSALPLTMTEYSPGLRFSCAMRCGSIPVQMPAVMIEKPMSN